MSARAACSALILLILLLACFDGVPPGHPTVYSVSGCSHHAAVYTSSSAYA